MLSSGRRADPVEEIALTVPEALERALAGHGAGDVDGASHLCRAILSTDPGNAGALNLLGVIEAQRGGYEGAVALFDRAIRSAPASEATHSNRGNALGALGRLGEAAGSHRAALSIRPDYAEALYNHANVLLATGGLGEALRGLGRALACRPDYPEALYAQGNVLQALGRSEAALRSYDRTLQYWPGHAETLANRAGALLGFGSVSRALASLAQALAVRPDLAEAWCSRGHALLELRRPAEALHMLDRALAVAPNYPIALNNHGNALSELGRVDDAVSSYDRALRLQPDYTAALYNRGNLQWRRKRHRESRLSLEKALALNPDYADAWSSRGGMMLEVKGLDQARASYGRMMALAPDRALSHSTWIFALDFFPGDGFVAHQKARRAWFRQHAEKHVPTSPRHANKPDPARRLTLGYVSGDFTSHSAAALFGPVLRRHDRGRFEVVCYSNVVVEDRKTQEFRALADRWRPVVEMPDDRLAEQIRSDGVDILVDLSGHSAGNRLLVFARKPAPIQVAAWGHGIGNGLTTTDYALADPVIVPLSVRSLYVEQIWDLPCLNVYEAPDYAPAVEAGGGDAGRPITFGCFNRFNKVSAESLGLWGRVLGSVAGSRLLLKDSAYADPEMRAWVLDTLAVHGIAADRIDFRGTTSHLQQLQAYNEIDIVLDPFPHNGGLTTWEALWMGRPVVARLGTSPSGRCSAAILTAVGMTEWIAPTDEAYVEIAVAGAADRRALARTRDGLRGQISASVAGNPEAYTRAVEDAYRAMWKRWCEQAGAR